MALRKALSVFDFCRYCSDAFSEGKSLGTRSNVRHEECWGEERQGDHYSYFSRQTGQTYLFLANFPPSDHQFRCHSNMQFTAPSYATDRADRPIAQRPKNRRLETLSNHGDERSNRMAAATFLLTRKNATFLDDQNQPCDLDVGQFGPLIMMRPHSSLPSFHSIHRRNPNRIGRNCDVNSSSSG